MVHLGLRVVGWLLVLVPLAAGSLWAAVSKETRACLDCHESMLGVVRQWEESAHWAAGVGCYECHQARRGEPDAMDHYGYTVAVIVSPRDCGRCHPDEAAQQEASRHAGAAAFADTPEEVLGKLVGGEAATVTGCRSCHGAVVRVGKGGQLDPATWPNGGIGRVNPDGSRGSCSACHQRHLFSVAQARHPESCNKCHLGPNHPQKEVYAESKHGTNFATFHERMQLDRHKWVVGEDYNAAPTCATCHLSATAYQPVTHDVGARSSWNLRTVLSEKMPDWEARRSRMKDVCGSCHNPNYIDGFYQQFDQFITLYNDKFARPATEIVALLQQEGVIDRQPFNEEVDWLYWELWHHEGRRARHGAAMMGPDYAWWQGMYAMGRNFYGAFLPAVKAACVRAGKPGLYDTVRAQFIDSREEHRWFTEPGGAAVAPRRVGPRP